MSAGTHDRRRLARLVAPFTALVLALGALVAAPAGAAVVAHPETTFAVGSPGMRVAQQLARTQWGADACAGQVSIVWTRLAPDVNATSTWLNPRSAYALPALNTGCRIAFNRSVPFDWPMFCTVVVHEYGHLTGHPHSRDPADVMTPIYSRPLRACAATPQPGVRARPAARIRTRASSRRTLRARISLVGVQSHRRS